MTAIQRAAAMPLTSLRGSRVQSSLQRRLLSEQSTTTRLGLAALAAPSRLRKRFAFTSDHTPPLAVTFLQTSFKSHYSTDPKLPTYFQPRQPPPKNAPAWRILRAILKVAGTVLVLVLGKTLGYFLLINDYRRSGAEQKKYADEQVQLIKEGKIDEYARYQEPGAAPKSAALIEKTTEILGYILSHPYVRANLEVPAALDGWEIVDPATNMSNDKLPADFLYFHMLRFFKEHSILTGLMARENAMPVPPLTWRDNEGKELVLIVYTGKDLCGHENIVHGGFVATLLDEALARCCFKSLPGKLGVTAYLHIDYRAPTPANGYIVIKAKTTKTEGRKAWVEARVETLPQANSGQAPQVLAEGKAMFVAPKEYTFLHKWLKSLRFENNAGL